MEGGGEGGREEGSWKRDGAGEVDREEGRREECIEHLYNRP